ncbi:MAG TPA: hypothetical protein VNO30_19030 [Kofleriaceae bacterium]|nr:hypothetical protein [Kofleriaceae bacterium]
MIALYLPLAACGIEASSDEPIDESELDDNDWIDENGADAFAFYGAAAFDDEDVFVSVANRRRLLMAGLHPRASAALRDIGVTAAEISQTIGDADDSAGYHHADGIFQNHEYTAAVDLKTEHLSNLQIHRRLEKLGKHGFAAWYRLPGKDEWPSDKAPHIHAVYANCKMKEQLQNQIKDYLNKPKALTGLSQHTIYDWHIFSSAARRAVRSGFKQSEHGTDNHEDPCGRARRLGKVRRC